MIHVAKVSQFSFSINFDEGMKATLLEVAEWGTVERFIESVLIDALLGPSMPDGYLDDLDDDVPF